METSPSDENEPLLQQEQPERRTCLQMNKHYIAQSGFWLATAWLLIGFAYLFVYCWYIPKSIRDSMNGIGPNITSVIIYSFSPLMAQVGLAIPMEPPKPVKVVVDFNLITLFSTNVVSLEPKTPVARFYFDNLVIEPKLPVIYWTHNVTVLDMNLPWISWVLGLFRSLGNIDLELSAPSVINIPFLMGSWNHEIIQQYSLTRGNISRIPKGNGSVSNFELEKRDDPKGTLYLVKFVLNFLNTLPFEIRRQILVFEFQVYHLHVPLLKIELVENLQLNRGQNAWHLAAQSIPEYTEELLSLVSHLSEGTMKTYITIKDVAFRGNVGMWGEIFRGKEFPIVIPPLDGELIANINAKI